MSELVFKQQTFVLLMGRLIDYVYRELNWKLTYGETYRTPEQAHYNVTHGLGIEHSLHTERLAIDLNLWTHTGLSANRDDYLKLGNYWKALTTPGIECCWGGDFRDDKGDLTGDIYHYSIKHNGYK